MNIAIKSLISDLEALVRNNSDIAPLARSVLDKYRDELPGLECSIIKLIDAKYQAAAKSVMQKNFIQDIDYVGRRQCRLKELIRSAPFFELKTTDLTTGKDDAGNDTYLFTVAADNSGSAVKARVECKFHLCLLKLNEFMRSQTGANRTFPFVVSFSLMVGEKLSSSLNLIDVSNGCSCSIQKDTQ